MRIPRIFTEQALNLDARISLQGDAANHLLKVLRMKAGRALVLFNGDGKEYPATIESCDKKTALLHINQVVDSPRKSPLHTELAIGVSRGDRMDWVLQKATELGVSRIVPLFTEHCEVKLNPQRQQKKQAQWQKLIQSSCEQCRRNTLPELAQACDLPYYLQQVASEKRFVLHHRHSQTLAQQPTAPSSVSLLIGPEGGLSSYEINAAIDRQFTALSLGPRVLRTETAPLVALSLLQYCWGDLA